MPARSTVSDRSSTAGVSPYRMTRPSTSTAWSAASGTHVNLRGRRPVPRAGERDGPAGLSAAATRWESEQHHPRAGQGWPAPRAPTNGSHSEREPARSPPTSRTAPAHAAEARPPGRRDPCLPPLPHAEVGLGARQRHRHPGGSSSSTMTPPSARERGRGAHGRLRDRACAAADPALGPRVPARLIVLPVWVATGLLTPIILGFPAQTG